MAGCSIEGCKDSPTPKTPKDMCRLHYSRKWHGTEMHGDSRRKKREVYIKEQHAEVQVGGKNKGISKIDLEDVNKVKDSNWSTDRNGYVVARINSKGVYLHHLVFGKPSKNMVVDHINRDILDNRKANLRFATKSENIKNSEYYDARTVQQQ